MDYVRVKLMIQKKHSIIYYKGRCIVLECMEDEKC